MATSNEEHTVLKEEHPNSHICGPVTSLSHLTKAEKFWTQLCPIFHFQDPTFNFFRSGTKLSIFFILRTLVGFFMILEGYICPYSKLQETSPKIKKKCSNTPPPPCTNLNRAAVDSKSPPLLKPQTHN